ncbi:MAG: ribonuclease P protein component [Patescibacteria group bacterium]
MRSAILKTRRAGSQTNTLIVVVGTSVSKKATERNLLKRRVRIIMKPYLVANRHDFTIILTKEALKRTFNDLKKEIIEQI